MAAAALPPTPDQPKTAFRAWARGRLKLLAPDREASASSQASAHAVTLLTDLPAGTLLAYLPTRGEIDPIMLLIAAIARDWTIAVPRCESRTSVPQVHALPPEAISPDSSGPKWNAGAFEEDAWGMLVPRARVPVRIAGVSAVLVPGLAFDSQGHRLGRGAGVYDRLLASLPPAALRIGLVHSDRVVPQLPIEPHDVRMHAVVTPDGVMHKLA